MLFVSATVSPGRLGEWEDVFCERYLKGTRAEPGNLRFDICRDPNDDHVFWMYAIYKNDAARDYHKNTQHFKDVLKFKESGGCISYERRFCEFITRDERSTNSSFSLTNLALGATIVGLASYIFLNQKK